MPFARYLCIFINVGLGEGSALPVGVPVPWPSATPPTGWLKCNGAAFSAEEYPELAKAYPTNKLPDLRGEFIRGWDDGRGVDNGRGLLTLQGRCDRVSVITTIGESGLHELTTRLCESLYIGTTILKQITPLSFQPLISIITQFPTRLLSEGGVVAATTKPAGANETRPRNVAFNYIVRAA